jgi:hypothetical protein
MLFGRYDASGGLPTALAPSFPELDYLAPALYSNLKSADEIIVDDPPSEAPEELLDNFMGFFLNADDIAYNEFEAHQYPSYFGHYRGNGFRSCEAQLSLAPEASYPGAWHRLIMAWNLRWPGDQYTDPEDMDLYFQSRKQLWLTLADKMNTGASLLYQQRASFPRVNHGVQSLEKNYSYPGNNLPSKGTRGLMIPFDSAMTLSFGESQARRLYGISRYYKNMNVDSANHHYYPFWRLNSSLDNIRVYFGSSDIYSSDRPGTDYFENDGNCYQCKGFYDAMRYRVVNKNFSSEHEGINEPAWRCLPGLEGGGRLISAGMRVYYPPKQDGNIPYVSLKAFRLKEDASIVEIAPGSRLPRNEQVLFFKGARVFSKEKLLLEIRYTARDINALDSDLSTWGEILKYTPSQGGHVTDIGWFKELNFRFIPSEGVKILSWEER